MIIGFCTNSFMIGKVEKMNCITAAVVSLEQYHTRLYFPNTWLQKIDVSFQKSMGRRNSGM